MFCSKSELLTWKAMFLPPRGLLWRRWQSLKLHYHIHAAAMLPHFIYKTGLFCILEHVSKLHFISNARLIYIVNQKLNYHIHTAALLQHFISKSRSVMFVSNYIQMALPYSFFMPSQLFITSLQSLEEQKYFLV